MTINFGGGLQSPTDCLVYLYFDNAPFSVNMIFIIILKYINEEGFLKLSESNNIQADWKKRSYFRQTYFICLIMVKIRLSFKYSGHSATVFTDNNCFR